MIKLNSFAAIVVIASTYAADAAAPPPSGASPQSIVGFLIESKPVDVGDLSPKSTHRLFTSAMAAKWHRAEMLGWWSNEPAWDGNWVVGNRQEFAMRSWRARASSPSTVAATIVGEDGMVANLTFRFEREAGAWRLADVEYGNGASMAKRLDQVGMQKPPGRVPQPSYDVDFKTGMLNGERGTSFEHNGSDVLVFERAGIIVYDHPRPAIAASVRRGDVVFRGRIADGRVDGVAYTFKKGCDPAPYEVKGAIRKQGYGGVGEIVLDGAAPIADAKSCAIDKYSEDTPNAHLRFAFTAGDF